MGQIKQILMKRDGLTEAEAQNYIEEAREALQEYLANGDIFEAHDICEEFFGLEPDYIFELM